MIKSSCDKELAELARAQKSIPQVSKSRRSSKGKFLTFNNKLLCIMINIGMVTVVAFHTGADEIQYSFTS